MAKTNPSWASVEMMGYAYYSDKGYRILISLVDNSIYNFVAEKSGVFLRVNVVQAFINDKSKPNSWAVSRAATTLTSHDYHSKIEDMLDIYLVWLPNVSKFIELDADFFKGTNSKKKLIPKALL